MPGIPAERLTAGTGTNGGNGTLVHLVSSSGLDNVQQIEAAAIDFVLDQHADIRYHAWHLQNYGAMSVSSPVSFRLPSGDNAGLLLVADLAGSGSSGTRTSQALHLTSEAGEGQPELVTGYYILALQASPGNLPVHWSDYHARREPDGDVVVSHHSAPATGFVYVVFRFEPVGYDEASESPSG